MVSEETKAVAVAGIQEINLLRDDNARLQVRSLALNNVCWSLADALGDLDDLADRTQAEIIPMDLVRRTLALVDMLEAKLAAVRDEIHGEHMNCSDMPDLALIADGCFVSNALHKIKAVLDA